MADESGHDDISGNGKPMNGYAKYLQVYGVGALGIIGIAVIWQTVIFPRLEDSRESNKMMQSQMPKQTAILEDIKDQGISTREWQQNVLKDHESQHLSHEAMIKELLKERPIQ